MTIAPENRHKIIETVFEKPSGNVAGTLSLSAFLPKRSAPKEIIIAQTYLLTDKHDNVNIKIPAIHPDHLPGIIEALTAFNTRLNELQKQIDKSFLSSTETKE